MDASTIVNTINKNPATFIILSINQISTLNATDFKTYQNELAQIEPYKNQLSTTIGKELEQGIIQMPVADDLVEYTNLVSTLLGRRQPVFIQSTLDELEQWNLSTLQLYANSLSSVINFQQSSIAINQSIERQYDYLILTSQSTITGYTYDIIGNSNLIIAGDVLTAKLISSNAELDSKVEEYDSTISGNLNIVSQKNIVLSSLVKEFNTNSTALYTYDTQFISAAVGYSTLYRNFLKADLEYASTMSSIYLYSSLILSSIAIQRSSYLNWQTSTATYSTVMSNYQSSINANNAMESTYLQYQKNEIAASSFYTSTMAGIKYISSLFESAVITQRYVRALSTQGSVIENYVNAYSRFVTTSTLAAMSSDSVLTQTREMSRQQMRKMEEKQTEASTTVGNLQKTVSTVYLKSYMNILSIAESNVQAEVKNVIMYNGFIDSTIASIHYWSSLHDKAVTDVISSIKVIEVYNQLYNSSVAGSNLLMSTVMKDQSTINAIELSTNAISAYISTLNINYSTFMSSYFGYMNESSMYSSLLFSSLSALSRFSTLYDSTIIASNSFVRSTTTINDLIDRNNNDIRTFSTVLEYEYINMLTYDTAIKMNFNLEEYSAFQYRETFVRQKRQVADNAYSAAVLKAVQNASTQNGTLFASGVTFTPVTVDISTGLPRERFTTLLNITNFINTFNNVYKNYDVQATNLEKVMTSIEKQNPLYTNVYYYANQALLYPSAASTIAANSTQAAYIALQNSTITLQQHASNSQRNIDAAKAPYFNIFNTLFTPGEIVANEDTISSFLRTGFANAASLLAGPPRP